jgi:hypothetical protein
MVRGVLPSNSMLCVSISSNIIKEQYHESRGRRAQRLPGEILKEEFLAEYGLSQNQLAKAIGIKPHYRDRQ